MIRVKEPAPYHLQAIRVRGGVSAGEEVPIVLARARTVQGAVCETCGWDCARRATFWHHAALPEQPV